MSAKNRLENKRKRRAEREAHREKVDRNRMLQARLNYLAYAPPDTYEELEEEVEKIMGEATE